MLELAPGRLFNFLRWEGGANSKEGRLFEGGRLFCLSIFGLKMTLSLFLVNPNCNIQSKHLCAHMDISIEEIRSKPVRL